MSVSEHCPYKGRRLLTGIRINLATATHDSWKIDIEGLASPLRREMSAGDKWSLGESHFYIPIRSDMDLSSHWFVVQIEELTLDYPENEQPKGYSFAHSARDIFTAN
jgi:hypothetical protein